MKQLTITHDEATAGFEETMRRRLTKEPQYLRGPGGRYPTREEIHDRPVPRR